MISPEYARLERRELAPTHIHEAWIVSKAAPEIWCPFTEVSRTSGVKRK
jgi:hypothetical protein